MTLFRDPTSRRESESLLRAANFGIALILLATLGASFIAYKTFRAHLVVLELTETNSDMLAVGQGISERVDFLLEMHDSLDVDDDSLLVERVQEHLSELVTRGEALDRRYRDRLAILQRFTWPADAVTDEEAEILNKDIPQTLKRRAREASHVSKIVVSTGFFHWETSTLVAFQSHSLTNVLKERQELLTLLNFQSMATLRRLLATLVAVLFVATCFVWIALFRPATQRLSKARQELGIILDTIPALVTTYSPSGQLQASNQSYLERWEFPELGTHVSDVVGPSLWPIIKPNFERALNGVRINFDIPVQMHDGEPMRMQNAQYIPIKTEKSEISGVVVIIEDVHDRHEAARALSESEEKLRTTLNSIGDAVISTDTQGVIMHMNPVACQITGWHAGEAINLPLENVLRIVNRDTRKRTANLIHEVLRTGAVVRPANRSVLISRSGREYDIKKSGAPIFSDEKNIIGVVVVFRDTTEEIALSERVVNSEKMRAIGQLAGGIAHDVNNQLAIIRGHAELMEYKDTDSVFTKNLEQVTATCDRAASLIGSLTAFAQQKPEHYRATNITQVISATLDTLRHTTDRRITLAQDILTKRTTVCGNPSILQSVFLNIALNSVQAMPTGGTLSVRIEEVAITNPLDAKFGHFHVTAGDFLTIAFRDTGAGIPAESLTRIFEPYFSTKLLGADSGGGAGLGLAMVYGVIKEHDGAVFAGNTAEGGAVITIMLPLLEQQNSNCAVPPAIEKEPASLQLRVLMVEDEKQLRDIGNRMLNAIGCKSTLAEDGEAALRIFNNAPEDFDLVLLDLNMPKMNGLETLEELKKIEPNVSVILATGFAGDLSTRETSDPSIFSVLRKPYSFSELSTILDQYAKTMTSIEQS